MYQRDKTNFDLQLKLNEQHIRHITFFFTVRIFRAFLGLCK